MPVTFDLVLTDMTMPSMTGDKLSIELLNIRPDLPIILSTGYSAKNNAEKALKIGIKNMVLKPVVEAGLAVFLASEASAYITGQVIFIDGGYMAM